MNLPDHLIHLIGNPNVYSIEEINELLKSTQSPQLLAKICKRSDVPLDKAILIAESTGRKVAVLSTLERDDISYDQSIRLIASTGFIQHLEPWPIIVSNKDTPLEDAISITIDSNSHDRWEALIRRKDFSAAKFLQRVVTLTSSHEDIAYVLDRALDNFHGNKVIKYLWKCSPKTASMYLNRAKYWRLSQLIVDRKDIPLPMLIQFTEVVNDTYSLKTIYERKEVMQRILSLPHAEAFDHIKRVPTDAMFSKFFFNYDLDPETLVSYLSQINSDAWSFLSTRIQFKEKFNGKGVSELCIYARKINQMPFWKFVVERDGFKHYLSQSLPKSEAIEIANNARWVFVTDLIYRRKDINLEDIIEGLNLPSQFSQKTLWDIMLESKYGKDFIMIAPLTLVEKKLEYPLKRNSDFWKIILSRKDLTPKQKIEIAKRVDDRNIWVEIMNMSDVRKFLKTPA